jgi:hypothetical protein
MVWDDTIFWNWLKWYGLKGQGPLFIICFKYFFNTVLN